MGHSPQGAILGELRAMSRPPPSPGEQIQFLQQLQRILSDGGFVATYKFALLHALADLSVIQGDDTGDELPLKTRDTRAVD